MRVVSLGCSEVGHVGVEILAALAALVLRVGEMDFAWSTVDQIAEIVQLSAKKLVTTAAFAAAGARPMRKVTTAFDDFGLGQILRIRDAFRGIRQVFARTEHDQVLLDKEFLAQRLPYSAQLVMIVRR